VSWVSVLPKSISIPSVTEGDPLGDRPILLTLPKPPRFGRDVTQSAGNVQSLSRSKLERSPENDSALLGPLGQAGSLQLPSHINPRSFRQRWNWFRRSRSSFCCCRCRSRGRLFRYSLLLDRRTLLRRLLGFLCCLPLRLRRGLLSSPVRPHALGLLSSLSGAELAVLPRWCGSGSSSRHRQRILRRATTALGWALKSFDGSAEFVSLRNHEGDDLICGHREDRNMANGPRSTLECPRNVSQS
jgi:hypothetical protein